MEWEFVPVRGGSLCEVSISGQRADVTLALRGQLPGDVPLAVTNQIAETIGGSVRNHVRAALMETEEFRRVVQLARQEAAARRERDAMAATVDELVARGRRLRVEAADGWPAEVRALDVQVDELRGQLGDATGDCDLLAAELATARTAASAKVRQFATKAKMNVVAHFVADHDHAVAALQQAVSASLDLLVLTQQRKRTLMDSDAHMLASGVLDEATASVLAGEPLPPIASDMPAAPAVDAQPTAATEPPPTADPALATAEA